MKSNKRTMISILLCGSRNFTSIDAKFKYEFPEFVVLIMSGVFSPKLGDDDWEE